MRKAIDHIVDGDSVPKWVTKKPEPGYPPYLPELWNTAIAAVRDARQGEAA